VVIGAGSHPFPFRTRKLSLLPPMVLHGKPCGRVGHCRGVIQARRSIRAPGLLLYPPLELRNRSIQLSNLPLDPPAHDGLLAWMTSRQPRDQCLETGVTAE
jgi:hypothetical protein